MRIPFLTRKSPDEIDYRKLAAKATRIGSAEAPSPRLTGTWTLEDLRAAGARSRAIRANGAQTS